MSDMLSQTQKLPTTRNPMHQIEISLDPNLSQGNQSIKVKESLKYQQMEKKKKGKLDSNLAAVPTPATVNKRTEN